MKNKTILLLFFFLISFCLFAQKQAEYNQKGDEAMQKSDFYDARMWYSEGVENCDIYSIQQLTIIWQENEIMRSSMRSIMSKCMNCLNEKAFADDPNAIRQLIIFYSEGIGVPKSEGLVISWKEKLEELTGSKKTVKPLSIKSKERMSFFVGYAYSLEAPFGLTVGGVINKIGWYVRYKSDFSSIEKYTHTCWSENNISHIDPQTQGKAFQANNQEQNKKKTFIGTMGFVYKMTPWLYGSIGAGYGERTLISPFHMIDHITMSKENIWCKNLDASYSGVVVELDAMARFKNIYLSAGCSSFNFKHIDLNAGIGLFF